jgi:hypothetical protein
MSLLRCSALVLAVLATSSFGAPAPTRILFVGNSLTYANDLPGMLTNLDPTIVTASVAHPNLALIDHLNGQSDAVARIAEGKWDYVVLQQGPTSRAIDRDTLILAVRGFDRHIRAAGGRTVVYMVWPSKDRFAYFDDVQRSYRLAAEDVGALLVPVGEAWRLAWKLDPGLALYDADDFHPSPLGSYLAALTFYECITGRDARRIAGPRAFETTIKALQTAAHEAAAECARQEQKSR